MSSPPRLTAALLGVRDGAARDYSSEAGSDAGSVAGDDAVAPHDPYARSKPTFRGALAGLGVDPAGAQNARQIALQRQAAHAQQRSAATAASAARGSRAPPSMDAFTRHKQLTSDWLRYYSGSTSASVAAASSAPARTDMDTLREAHRFVRSEADDAEVAAGSHEARMAKRYYDRLFREYTLADMSRYKSGQLGLRWRTSEEVLSGRGQFSCGNKACTSTEQLKSFELHFGYLEAGVAKQALVKLRLCPPCAAMLHHQKLKELEAREKTARRAAKEVKREKKLRKEHKKESHKSKKKKSRKRGRSSSSDSSSDSDSDVEEVSKSARLSSSADAASSATAASAKHAVSEDGFALPLPRPVRSRGTETQPATASAATATSSAPAASSAVPVSPRTQRAELDDFFQQYFPEMFP